MKNIKSGLVFAFLLLAALSSAFAQPNVQSSILHPKGLLWKIEKQGMPASYLFGTMHVGNARVTQLPKKVERAFIKADHFVMEVVLDAKAVEYIGRVSIFNDGQTLKNNMMAADYANLVSLLGDILFMTEKKLNKMKPWAVMMLLIAPAEAQGGLPLDLALYQKAIQLKLTLHGLETAKEQIDIFESMSRADQVWLLNRALEDVKSLDEQFDEMLNAYVARDLAQLHKIQQSAMHSDSDIDDQFMYQLIDVRNIRMVKRMLPILQMGKAFIAIGALHLSGETGVLHLLEKQGYQVTVVY